MSTHYESDPYSIPSRDAVTKIKSLYPIGTRIRLDLMPNDPCPVAPGSVGTVNHVNDFGGLSLIWDITPRSLRLLPNIDQFTVLQPHDEQYLKPSK